MKDFQCCATCEHFKVIKLVSGIEYRCSRLNYETKPNYRFNCWNPTEKVKKLMEKEQKE